MKTIGKYEICGLLGRGGMGVVYKARLPIVNKIVALKLLAPYPHLVQLLGEDEIRRRFISEAATMASLRHPHVVEVLDFDLADGRPFFVMEYYYQNLGMLMGESYRIESPSRIFSLDKAILYTRQILLGLSRLHRAGMVHRDIKPYNLLITDQDQLKISDFGLSKLRGERWLNPPGLVVGSPFYAAPEQEGDPEGVDARADLYSVGIVLCRMLTGLLPDEVRPLPSECHPDVDPSWNDYVFKAIERERGRRFSSADEMLRALEKLNAAWEEKKRNLCRMVPPHSIETRSQGPIKKPVRHRPVKVTPMKAKDVFPCDSLWRPMDYTENDFQVLHEPDLVLDRSTGLLWQRSGSEDPLSWQEARMYIDHLNTLNHAEYSSWRLPTVNELFSLLKPVAHGEGDCIEAVFDRGRKWLWSIDLRSFIAAWYVDTELGFAGWGDFTCHYFVRAVCWKDG